MLYDDLALGVDALDALGHDGCFWFSDSFRKGVNLAVHIGQAEVVEVHEGELANARTGQGFRCPGSDATDADDGEVG